LLGNTRIITVLDLSYISLKPEDIKVLVEILKDSLDLPRNNFRHEADENIALLLKLNKTLKELSVTSSTVELEICESIEVDKSLTILNLEKSHIDSAAISAALVANGTLKHVNLRGVGLRGREAIILSERLRLNKVLTHLNIRDNHI
jgi:hypothetical protein